MKIDNIQNTVIKEKELIKKLIGYNPQKIVSNDEGSTSRVYLVDDAEICFKFSKDDLTSRNELHNEKNILMFLNTKEFDVFIPRISWTNDKPDFIGYYGFKGQLLENVNTNSISLEEREKMGIKFGSFLHKLHNIEYNNNSNVKNNEYFFSKFQTKYKKIRENLLKYFSEKDMLSLDKLFFNDLSNELNKYGEKLSLCHGDFAPYNIIITKENDIGIIDFGNSGLMDESIDFMGIEDEIILKNAINTYGSSDVLRNKIYIRKLGFAVQELDYYFSINDTKKIEKMINFIKQFLERRENK